MKRTTKKLTLATLTGADFDWLDQARDTQRWRIVDASMAPEFLPGDSLHTNPQLVPETGDLAVARRADGSRLIGHYKARRGKKDFDLVPVDERRPTERFGAKSLLGVAFMHTRKMRIDGKPRSAWRAAP
jgi:hypothetical protein